jgi:hypothetical protein
LPHHNDNDNDDNDPCSAFGVGNEPMTSQVFRTWLVVANGLVVGLAVMLGLLAGSPARHFGESGFTTWVSGAQLVAISVVTWKIWRLRGGTLVPDAWRAPHFVWLLIAAGFLAAFFGTYWRVSAASRLGAPIAVPSLP